MTDEFPNGEIQRRPEAAGEFNNKRVKKSITEGKIRVKKGWGGRIKKEKT